MTENQPPPTPQETSTQPPAPPAGSTGLPPHVAAGLAALFPLLGGIVFFVLEKKDQFVRFYAMQSIYFGGGMFVLSIAVMLISAVLSAIPFLGPILAILLGIVFFIIWIGSVFIWLFSTIKAFTGVRWEIPFFGGLAKEQLAKIDGAPTA